MESILNAGKRHEKGAEWCLLIVAFLADCAEYFRTQAQNKYKLAEKARCNAAYSAVTAAQNKQARLDERRADLESQLLHLKHEYVFAQNDELAARNLAVENGGQYDFDSYL